jgi:cytoskeletal protein CcmA (bactofilin family)
VLKQIINQDDSSDASKPAEETAAAAAPKPRLSAPLSGMTGGKNILSSDVEIKGKLRFSNDLIIDGRIEGEVNSEGDLTVGENAQIVGDVKTRSVVVFGRIEGNITVTDRCELKQNAILHGDVAAGKLAIEEGATFMGSSTVGTPRSGSKAPAKPAGGQPTEGQ